ncbi:hypothetical protein BDW68DRAFT_179394 [Aspergillus falconensis]
MAATAQLSKRNKLLLVDVSSKQIIHQLETHRAPEAVAFPTDKTVVAAKTFLYLNNRGGNDTGSEFTFEELLDEEMVVIERDFANLDDRHPCWLEVWNIDSSSTRSKLFLQFRRGFPSKYRESAFAVNPTGTRVPFAFAPVGDAERDAGPREAVAVEEWDIINSEILCTHTL